MIEHLEALPNLLAEAKRPGDYYTAGTIAAPLPLIEVDGVGPLAFPVLGHQARQLLEIAQPAPYGRGAQTLVDPTVRRAGQIAPERITLDAEGWQPVLDSITQRVKRGLGVRGRIEAQLYKMLVYGPGDFFAEHRDTEKAAGMFATLVVLLPARWRGGALVVRHGEREVTLASDGHSPSTISYAAFYTDCLHALRPITEGHRIALVYNVCRASRRALSPPDHAPLVQAVADRLSGWVDGGGPTKALFPLEHKYTPAALGFDGLKGRDQARVQVLLAAAERADCTIHLAIVSIRESGLAELTWAPSRYRGWGDTEGCEFEAVEAYDHKRSVDHWCHPDGDPVELGKIPFHEDELFPYDALEGEDPDEESFHEATGNEGASYARTYRRAVVALWPRANFALVWASAEPGDAIETLSELTHSHDPRAVEFALALVDRWPTIESWRRRRHDLAYVVALAALDVHAVAEAFAHGHLARFAVTEDMATPLTDLIARCSAQVIRDSVAPAAAARTPVDGNPWPMVLAGLLNRSALDHDTARALAEAVISHLPAGRVDEYRRTPTIGPPLVVGLVWALADLDDAGLTVRAMGHLEAYPDVFDADAVLVPAALQLVNALDTRQRQHIAFTALVDQCLEHLDARIAEPLAEPESWRQTVDLRCRCRLCKDFATFLARDQRVWAYKVAKAGRRHLYGKVSSRTLDVDARTIRVGSPLTWEATKTRKSYEARVEQRERDLTHRDRLQAGRGAPI